MKVLVIGGIHGNEPLGLAVVSALRQISDPNIDTLLANEQAIQAKQRFVAQDLNRSFPGNLEATEYEARRAAELVTICTGYDIVLDFHNTQCQDNDCTFVGTSARPVLFDASAFFGLNRVIVADYDCLNKYAPNCISIEISTASKRMKVDDWVSKITELAQCKRLPKADDLTLYKFVYRMTQADRQTFGLDELQLKAFEMLPQQIASAFSISGPAYPIFIGDGYTPYNYGGVLSKINV